jgi:hypothetical protein
MVPNGYKESGDARDFRAGICWGWGILFGVPAHEGESAAEDCEGDEDSQAHRREGRAYQHYQIEEILHISPSQREFDQSTSRTTFEQG